MQMFEMAGYFKKYWKDREHIGARGHIHGKTGASGIPPASVAADPNQNAAAEALASTPRVRKPLRQGYEQERNARRTIDLAALAERIKGGDAEEQLDIDALKAEVLNQLQTNNFDQKATARALHKILRRKGSAYGKEFKKVTATDADLWTDLGAELNLLAESETKPNAKREANNRELKQQLFEGLLGPAGPLYRVSRELWSEHKEQAQHFLGWIERSSKIGAFTVGTIRKIGERASASYKRWTGKLKSGLIGILGKLKEGSKGLWKRILSARIGNTFGRAGAAIARGSRGASQLLRNPNVLAGMAVAGLAVRASSTMTEKEPEPQAQSQPTTDETTATSSGAEQSAAAAPTSASSGGADLDKVLNAGDIKLPAKPLTEGDSSERSKEYGRKHNPTVREQLDQVLDPEAIKKTLKNSGSEIGSLFADLGTGILGRWKHIMSGAQSLRDTVNEVYNNAQLKGRMNKDDVQEYTDKLWDDLEKWVGGIWSKVKGFFGFGKSDAKKSPDGTTSRAQGSNVGQQSQQTVKQDSAKAGDGVNNPTQLAMAAPAAGATGNADKGRASVTISGGADVAGSNQSMMSQFYAMADEFHTTSGRKIQLNSAKRDSAKQAALYAANPAKAARPGYSMHEYGYALDINSAEANMLDQSGLLKKYGFVRPLLNIGETWHIEPTSIQGQKAAIRRGQAQLEQPAAIANDADKPKTESEGATNKDLKKDLATSTQATTPVTSPPANTQAPVSTPSATTPVPATTPAPATVTPAVPTSIPTKSPAEASVVTAPPIEPPKISVTPALDAQTAQTSRMDKAVAPVVTAPKSLGLPVDGAGNVESSGLMPPSTEQRVSQVPAPTPVYKPMMPTISGSDGGVVVAPKADAGSYTRVQSRSKVQDVEIDASEQDEPQSSTGYTTGQIGVNSIPLYLGDMGLMSLNLGSG